MFNYVDTVESELVDFKMSFFFGDMKKLSRAEEVELCFQMILYKYALRHCVKII